jgi:hypothetical protein
MRTALVVISAVLLSCAPVDHEVVVKNTRVDAQIQSFIDTAAKYTQMTVTGFHVQLTQRDSLLEFLLSQGIPATCRDVLGFKRYGQSIVYFLGDSLPLRYMDGPPSFACDLSGSPLHQEQLPDPPFSSILYFDGRHFYRRQIPKVWSTGDDYYALPLILAD